MKVNRHAKIIELINKYHIETQEELAEYLNREGFKVTQATVSRDIRDLKLTKIPSENGKQRYALHQHHESAMSEKYIRVKEATVYSCTSYSFGLRQMLPLPSSAELLHCHIHNTIVIKKHLPDQHDRRCRHHKRCQKTTPQFTF